MKKIAVFPGSFDPFTRGHENIVQRGLSLFDEIVVAIGTNSQKKYMFSMDQRVKIISDTFKDYDNVNVKSYSGLTVDYCQSIGSSFILRGIRNSRDLDFEQAIAQMNKELNPEIETVFLVNKPEYSAFNSSIVREIYANNGNISSFIPEGVEIEK